MTKRIRTKSTTEQLREILDKTDAVLIGAGAGLSTSAGFVYDGERFRKYFADFEEKYLWRRTLKFSDHTGKEIHS